MTMPTNEIGMPGGQNQAPLPTPVDYKKSQTNILAELIPQIMNAMGGGDPYTQKLLQQQSQQNRARNEKATQRHNLRGFMRSVAMPATGSITPELIMEQAELWGIDPAMAMDVVGNFQKFRQGQKKEGFTLSPGQTRYDATGNPLASMPGGETMPFGSSKLGIYDKRTGQVTSGAPKNQPSLQRVPDGRGGWKFVRPAEGMTGMNNPGKGMSVEVGPDGTTVRTGVDNSNVPKGAQTGLFKDVVSGQTVMDELNYIDSLYEPKFLTYGGWFQNVKANVLNKLDPEERDRFTQRRESFISAANQSYLKFRKWATGVAGGEKEMAEIKRTVPNENDSPQAFEAKMKTRKSLTRRLVARQKAALKAGVNNEAEFKQYLQAHPLGSIPTLQQRGDSLSKMGYSEDQILRILADEGYILKGGK